MNKEKFNRLYISTIISLTVGIFLTVLLVILLGGGNSPQKGYIIKNNTVKTDTYVMYEDGSDFGREIPNSINLKVLSEENHNIDTFIIEGTITHTIFIPSDFSCSLVGTDGSKIIVDDNNLTDLGVCGVIIGNDEKYQENANSEKKIEIYNNDFLCLSAYGCFNIYDNSRLCGTLNVYNNTIFSNCSWTDSTSAGIFIKGMMEGTTNISGNTIVSNNGVGVCFEDDVEGGMNIENNNISSISNKSAGGVMFRRWIGYDSQIFIANNVLLGSDLEGGSSGICFLDNVWGNVKIINNSIFSSSEQWLSSGIYWGSNNGSSGGHILITNNILVVSCEEGNAFGIECSDSNGSGEWYIINNIISVSCSQTAAGVYLRTNIIGEASIIIRDNSFSCFIANIYMGIYFWGNIGGDAEITVSWNTINGSCKNPSGIYFRNDVDGDVEGTNNLYYYHVTNGGSNGGSINGFFDRSVFFANGDGEGEQSGEFGKKEYTEPDIKENEFTFKLYYPTSVILNQEESLVTKLGSYLIGEEKYVNKQCIEIVEGLML